MYEWGNCPTGHVIREQLRQWHDLPDETIPVMFLSSAVGVALMRLLAEQGGDHELLMVVVVSGGHEPDWGRILDPSAGLDFGPETIILDPEQYRMRLSSAMRSFEVEDVALMTFSDRTLPFWQRVNQAPASAGRGVQKGGKRLHQQKGPRS